MVVCWRAAALDDVDVQQRNAGNNENSYSFIPANNNTATNRKRMTMKSTDDEIAAAQVAAAQSLLLHSSTISSLTRSVSTATTCYLSSH
jgi:hypothetical protein